MEGLLKELADPRNKIKPEKSSFLNGRLPKTHRMMGGLYTVLN